MRVGERRVAALSRSRAYGFWCMVFAAVPLTLAGCSNQPSRGMQAIGPEDFASSSQTAQAETGLAANRAAQRPSGRQPLDASAFVASGEAVLVPPPVDPADVEASFGPEVAPLAPIAQPVLFDVKVGEVNNKPVFAAEFLDPIAQRLRAMAYRDVRLPGGGTTAQIIPREQWRREANQVIVEQLRSFVENELVIAEGLASFTPAQRTGLRNFIGIARQSLERNAGGSITRAVRELGTGQTLSEYLQEVRNQELIQKFYADLRRTIVVTRSDVQRAYLRRYGDARRESTLSFRRIRVPLRDEEGAARVSERLAAGESFEEVATDEANTSRRSAAGLWPAMTFQGERSDASFFANAPDIDAALRELTPGEWRGPMEDERNVHWVYVDGVEIGYKTWAEAQSELREELFMQRFEQANYRAMLRLYEQAGMTDIQTMRAELLEVATAWFYPTS